mmetsp:Transcript_16853/g.31915  ORF Transcript_16853/g.31915 Transcript_16853/m.31915 type:complete len:333 (+) Transcript_16853:95-1093(+)
MPPREIDFTTTKRHVRGDTFCNKNQYHRPKNDIVRQHDDDESSSKEQDDEYSYFNNNKKKNKTKKKNSPAFLFRIGALRFGLHGIAGSLSFIMVTMALIWKISSFSCSCPENDRDEEGDYNCRKAPVPFSLAFAISSSSLVASLGSRGLLSQVPTTSHIASWIFPPHREAFKRTISIIVYLNMRLANEWKWISTNGGGECILFPVILGCYTIFSIHPFKSSFSNGNTWVFVIPMFLGFCIDSYKQFPSIQFIRTNSSNTAKSIPHYNVWFDWTEVHGWNSEKVNETFLLLTLLCALEIAFMFTVAFRGMLSIQTCYWAAAIQVAILFVLLVW